MKKKNLPKEDNIELKDVTGLHVTFVKRSTTMYHSTVGMNTVKIFVVENLKMSVSFSFSAVVYGLSGLNLFGKEREPRFKDHIHLKFMTREYQFKWDSFMSFMWHSLFASSYHFR